MRTGSVPYLVLAGMVALLLGVGALVLAGNEVSERKDELASVTREDEAAQKRAEELAPYVQLAELRSERASTVASLADSRFDWERVMRELAKVLPADVWLTNLDASAGGEASSGTSESSGGESSALRGAIAGPALQLTGCANGQKGVAGFVNALKQIDGVTRVGVQSSAISAAESSAESGGGGGGGASCQTRPFVAQFQMVVGFDAAPVPETSESAETVEETTSEASEESSSTSSEG